MLPILHHLGLTYPVSVTPNEVPKIAGEEASGRVVLHLHRTARLLPSRPCVSLYPESSPLDSRTCRSVILDAIPAFGQGTLQPGVDGVHGSKPTRSPASYRPPSQYIDPTHLACMQAQRELAHEGNGSSRLSRRRG